MKRLIVWLPVVAALLVPLLSAPTRAAEAAGRSPFESSVVTLEITAKEYDFTQPWNTPTRSVRKHAVVTGERTLLTTAQNLPNQTLVRAQKGGRGRWFNAEVKWLDYHANVALVTVAEPAFWNGLKPVDLAREMPRRNNYDVIRWRDGNLEVRRAEFSKFTVGEGSMSFAPRIHLELNSEISGLGWAEPVAVDGKVVGLTVSKGGNVCSVVPFSFLSRIVDAQLAGKFPGLGYFDFLWQPGQNPATLDHLKLEGDPRGAVVIDVPKNVAADYAIKKNDILLSVDGREIDMEGDYDDPEYGHVILEGLATRRHFAGDKIPMKIWRDGKMIEIQYVIPKASYSVDLLPMFAFDREPEYLIAGGLVFQPLHQPYLRGYGEDWRRRGPFRLVYFSNQSPTPERPTLVVLSQVLPDPFNVGYQEYRNLVVDKLNGRKISKLGDVKDALKEAKDGLHLIEFTKGDTLQRMRIDAGQLGEATDRVLERFGIRKAEVIH